MTELGSAAPHLASREVTQLVCLLWKTPSERSAVPGLRGGDFVVTELHGSADLGMPLRCALWEKNISTKVIEGHRRYVFCILGFESARSLTYLRNLPRLRTMVE